VSNLKNLICNPLNLDYRYQIRKAVGQDGQVSKTSVYREGADPTVIRFNEHYLMFVSMSGGFWYSEDLCEWHFKPTPELPTYDYAPDVAVVGGAVVFSASKSNALCTIFRSADPINLPFEPVSTSLTFWDPHIFQDDDGRVYLYWGCSSREPIYGVEVDPETLVPLGEKYPMICENEDIHGWERNGENNVLGPPKDEMEARIRHFMGTKPFIEGPFVNKHSGMYYFQYAAPGTEYNVYGDGVYIGDSPLGPFKYQKHNPFSSKPGGFIAGAGHGSTFSDKHGNMWHASTMRISVNEGFERRVGLFPCEVDKDGILHCNQHFIDYPFYIPNGKVEKIADMQPPYMLLSYNKPTIVSSSQDGYGAANATNENIRTWWAAESISLDEYIVLDLEVDASVNAVQINFADHKMIAPDLPSEDFISEMSNTSHRHIMIDSQYIGYLFECSRDGEKWEVVQDKRATGSGLPHDLIVFENSISFRYLRINQISMPFDGVPAISGIRVFGNGNGATPAQVKTFAAEKEADGMAVNLSWEAAENAIGYNVRYGIARDKLYSSWQLHGETTLRLSTLNSGTAYYIAVDSFNESGISSGVIQEIG